ncbi:MAG TPA: hypothetical protein VGQ53_21585 [Chitinophagaceae bacterium]|jgi:hypothetical protein|nr:hypothetical protein [Chitinophagaceae bacterium]
MRGLDNQLYVILLIISNVVAILQLVAAIKWPRLARLSFFFLFAWASWANWSESQRTPQFYLEYADLTWSSWYRNFIKGWFADHIQLAVGFVALCQGLIAVSMLLKGWIYKIGSVGAVVFLLSILPFGVGSGFPCTAIMAIALIVLLRKYNHEFIWSPSKLTTPIK